jgi:ribosomal protein S18 acetylase RimI-like enzyme
MQNSNSAFVVRRCRPHDIASLSRLLKVCWHATYDRMLGERQAVQAGRHLHSKFNLGLWIARSLISRDSTVLVATRDGTPVGHAMAQRDGAEIILYSLYVHPEWQGKGIGSALLDAVIAGHPEAKAIRLEVLKDNAAAIAWYRTKGFESYGATENATGTAGIASAYMDKKLVAHTP